MHAPLTELTNDDMDRIQEIFSEEITPKLRKLHARLGTLNCGFAGEQYKYWTIRFGSVGDDFHIVEFEYDEESAGLDLDL
jgi:hypothetical protein